MKGVHSHAVAARNEDLSINASADRVSAGVLPRRQHSQVLAVAHVDGAVLIVPAVDELKQIASAAERDAVA